MSESERQRRLSIEGRLADLVAKHGGRSEWVDTGEGSAFDLAWRAAHAGPLGGDPFAVKRSLLPPIVIPLNDRQAAELDNHPGPRELDLRRLRETSFTDLAV